MYTALDIAKYVVTKCSNDGCPISNLHLQKILYYLQKEYLQNGTTGLFVDEIQAWKFGPVVESVYFYFCSNGASAIDKKYDISIDTSEKSGIDQVIDIYKLINPWELVQRTHKPEKAWAKIFSNGAGNYQIIPKQLIAEIG